MYFDGISFETAQHKNAKVIEGPLAHAAVYSIWGADVEILMAPELSRYTFEHESGNMTFIIKALNVVSARAKLAKICCSEHEAATYWKFVMKETVAEATRQICNNGSAGTPA
jgi:hypothetical protein